MREILTESLLEQFAEEFRANPFFMADPNFTFCDYVDQQMEKRNKELNAS
ncbi:hypothetical protein Q7A53_05675 [Halobacillus rhizosphaerae]